ncbi:predicted protein [Histoplasma mississippiense (nom. inval.)]|uniref:predicted protein n=1 Tax=Ajellomyces capsulatus (strain NAm1 / WU24) TaxID=2059318 RepID=UPI000157C8D3|nr:predicted protein [Histoplasma mississippiense (nom. inval.)]EDN09641.1 predicted protein [Histoplasma mississippiense (nom. inval.)]
MHSFIEGTESLGPGERISLAKLAIDHLQRTSRPIRVAIDISIWLFQVQAGKGGTNPELRTLFYRLVRLTGLPVHPLFIYDGPQRPQYKRGKLIDRNNRVGDLGRIIRRSKHLIDLFHFPHHTAPGEAEAECARLQSSGVVDAVMSDDVDAIMFGSKVTIMNFSKENSSGTNAATHVTLYQTEESGDGRKRNVLLDRGAMILFALLSGGDYLPTGVPKCGPKLAREIIQAGFGNELLQAIEGSPAEVAVKLEKWRERLRNELHENGEGHFRCKHKAVKIPDCFPDLKVLGDYTHPVVSSSEKLNELQRSFKWDQAIDIEGLRNFVWNDFGWQRGSARRLTKVLAAPLVCNRLRLCLPLLAKPDTLPLREPKIGTQFCGQRFHYSTDGLSELRLEFIPTDIVGLDLTYEPTTASQRESESEDLDNPEEDVTNLKLGTRRRTTYDPTQKEKVWVFEAIAEMGMPDAVMTWNFQKQEKLALAEKRVSRKRAPKMTKPKVVDPKMKFGEILKYCTVVKSPGTRLIKFPSSSSQKHMHCDDSTITNGYASELESPSSQACSPSKRNSIAKPRPLEKAALSDIEATMNFERANESDQYNTSVETIEKAMLDMKISSDIGQSSPTKRGRIRTVSHKAAGLRAIPPTSPQTRNRNKYKDTSNIFPPVENLDIERESNPPESNTIKLHSRLSISEYDLPTADDMSSQFSGLKIQDCKVDEWSESSHTIAEGSGTSQNIPPASTAAKLSSNDDRKELLFETENSNHTSNSQVEVTELPVIEIYNGYWAYRQRTNNEEQHSPEVPSDNQGNLYHTQQKTILDKKLGKMKLRGRILINR